MKISLHNNPTTNFSLIAIKDLRMLDFSSRAFVELFFSLVFPLFLLKPSSWLFRCSGMTRRQNGAEHG
jgi:hypothetical protein